MKKILLSLCAMLLAGASSVLADTKTIYAEVTQDESGDRTLTFRAVSNPTYSATEGLGTFQVENLVITTGRGRNKIEMPMPPGYLNGDNKSKIMKVVFEESVKDALPKSAYCWFDGLAGLETIEGLEYLNTSEVTDMSLMFDGCTSLKSLDLSHFNTSKVTTMQWMFRNCTSLTSLKTGEGFVGTNATDISKMFSNCSSLTSLDLTSFNPQKATDMSELFENCSNLETLNLGTWDVGNVTTMTEMFKGCKNLTTLSSHFTNADNVTDMSRMFMQCEKLKGIDMDVNTPKLKDISFMFEGCSALTDLKLDHFNTSEVTTMEELFYQCANLSNIKFGENFKTDKVTNMIAMFGSCHHLGSIDLSQFNTENVTNMAAMFDHTVATISNLKKLNTSKVTNMAHMFYQCFGNDTLDVSNFDTSNVTDMHGMFGDNGVKYLNVSNFDISKVTDAEYFLNRNAKLRELNVGGNDFSKLNNKDKILRVGFLESGNDSVFSPVHLVYNFDISRLGDANPQIRSLLA